LLTKFDETGLEIFVPEETVVGTLPKWEGCAWFSRIALECVCEVVSVGKVEWIIVEMISY